MEEASNKKSRRKVTHACEQYIFYYNITEIQHKKTIF